jgi:hypothetical protein
MTETYSEAFHAVLVAYATTLTCLFVFEAVTIIATVTLLRKRWLWENALAFLTGAIEGINLGTRAREMGIRRAQAEASILYPANPIPFPQHVGVVGDDILRAANESVTDETGPLPEAVVDAPVETVDPLPVSETLVHENVGNINSS